MQAGEMHVQGKVWQCWDAGSSGKTTLDAASRAVGTDAVLTVAQGRAPSGACELSHPGSTEHAGQNAAAGQGGTEDSDKGRAPGFHTSPVHPAPCGVQTGLRPPGRSCCQIGSYSAAQGPGWEVAGWGGQDSSQCTKSPETQTPAALPGTQRGTSFSCPHQGHLYKY